MINIVFQLYHATIPQYIGLGEENFQKMLNIVFV